MAGTPSGAVASEAKPSDWRPACELDSFEVLLEAVDLYVTCIRDAASQVSEDRSAGDKRADLAQALAEALREHGKSEYDYVFANQAVTRRVGPTDDRWDSLTSLFTSLAGPNLSRRAMRSKLPMVAFVRYRGAGPQRIALFQLWVRIREPNPGEITFPSFVLDHPLRTADMYRDGNKSSASPPAAVLNNPFAKDLTAPDQPDAEQPSIRSDERGRRRIGGASSQNGHVD